MNNLYKHIYYVIFSLIKRINKRFSDNLIAHNSYTFLSFLVTIDIDFIIWLLSKEFGFIYRKYLVFIVFAFVYLTNTYFFVFVYKPDILKKEISEQKRETFLIYRAFSIFLILISLIPVILLFFK